MVKNFGGKKFGEKTAAKDWRKKLWRMLTCIANHKLTVKRSQTKKQFQTSMNIIKQTPYFPGFVLVSCGQTAFFRFSLWWCHHKEKQKKAV